MTIAAAVEVKPLEYVREHLGATPKKDWTRIAADAGVSMRTLYNLTDAARNANYDTVMRVQEVLKKSKQAEQ